MSIAGHCGETPPSFLDEAGETQEGQRHDARADQRQRRFTKHAGNVRMLQPLVQRCESKQQKAERRCRGDGEQRGVNDVLHADVHHQRNSEHR
jgi:hypothetical protein